MVVVVTMFETIIQFKDYLAVAVILFASFVSVASIISGRLVDATLPSSETPSKYTNPKVSAIAFTLCGDMCIAIGAWLMIGTKDMIMIAMSGIFMLFGFMVLFTVIAFSFAVCQKYKSNLRANKVGDQSETSV